MERLASAYGWKYKDVIARLEAKRKEKSAKYYNKKVSDDVFILLFIYYFLET